MFCFDCAGTRQTCSPLEKKLGNSLFCVPSAPILCGQSVIQGKPSLTVCASVRMAMRLSVGVNLTGATHVGCGPTGDLEPVYRGKGGAAGGKR